MSEYLESWKEFLQSDFNPSSEVLDKHIFQQKTVEEILPLSDNFFVVVNMHTAGYEFIGSNVKASLGYSPDEFLEKGVNYFLSLLHPDDAPKIVYGHHKTIGEVINSYPIDKRKLLSFQCTYRLKTEWGKYAFLLEQANVLELNKNGQVDLFLVNISVLNQEIVPEIVSIAKVLDENGFNTTVAKNLYNANSLLDKLTNREFDVARLLLKGYKSRAIGEKLFISPQTVDTHRKRILKKLNLNSTSELISFAYRNLFI